MERVERLSQAYSQAPWRKQLQILGLLLLGIVFAALVASVYLNVTARASKTGREIQLLQSEIRKDEQVIADLTAQLGTMYSNRDMELRARALGFNPRDMDEAVFLTVPGYAERQPANLAPAYQKEIVSAPVLPDEYTESLLIWLQKKFNQIIFPLFTVQP